MMLTLTILLSSFYSFAASATTATCQGKYKTARLFFSARGSLMNKNDGSGFVKINGRVLAQFDGDYAKINYFMRTFAIRNNRGDVVEGKLNNISTGAATLTKLELHGEGIRLYNVPVSCSMN
jgi:hypothetical protein